MTRWAGGQDLALWQCDEGLGRRHRGCQPVAWGPQGRKSPVGKWWRWLPASYLRRFDTRKGWRGEGRLRVSSFPPSRSNGSCSGGPSPSIIEVQEATVSPRRPLSLLPQVLSGRAGCGDGHRCGGQPQLLHSQRVVLPRWEVTPGCWPLAGGQPPTLHPQRGPVEVPASLELLHPPSGAVQDSCTHSTRTRQAPAPIMWGHCGLLHPQHGPMEVSGSCRAPAPKAWGHPRLLHPLCGTPARGTGPPWVGASGAGEEQ